MIVAVVFDVMIVVAVVVNDVDMMVVTSVAVVAKKAIFHTLLI
jgi:hypothetical protein